MSITFKNILKTVLISLSSLIIGFLAISLPFDIFDNLTAVQTRILFLIEIITYSLLFALSFLVKERKEAKAKKKKIEKIRKEKRRIKLLKDLEEFNMVA